MKLAGVQMRNRITDLASASRETGAAVQTKSREKLTASAKQARKRRAGFNSPKIAWSALLVFSCGFLWFVWQMQGFDGDTIYLGLYCAILATFCFEAISGGLNLRG